MRDKKRVFGIVSKSGNGVGNNISTEKESNLQETRRNELCINSKKL